MVQELLEYSPSLSVPLFGETLDESSHGYLGSFSSISIIDDSFIMNVSFGLEDDTQVIAACDCLEVVNSSYCLVKGCSLDLIKKRKEDYESLFK